MTIEEILAKREELRAGIANLVYQFEQQTGCRVDSIHIGDGFVIHHADGGERFVGTTRTEVRVMLP